MMQHQPPPDGVRIDNEEHAKRIAQYKARVKRAMERYEELKRKKEEAK